MISCQVRVKICVCVDSPTVCSSSTDNEAEGPTEYFSYQHISFPRYQSRTEAAPCDNSNYKKSNRQSLAVERRSYTRDRSVHFKSGPLALRIQALDPKAVV
jgi:hypothetical protein